MEQPTGCTTCTTLSSRGSKKKWRRPKVTPAGVELFLEFHRNNQGAVGEEPGSFLEMSRKLPWIHSYQSLAMGVTHVPGRRPDIIYEEDLSVQYWFYIYTYSSNVDLVMKPFGECCNKCPTKDKRMERLMRTNGVVILLQKGLELYRSLPRRLVVVKAPNWERLVAAMSDLECAFPEMMRFASYPEVMQTDTCRFPSSGHSLDYSFTRAGTFRN